ncbi:nuclear transport factor 2 family protein [Actinokineospora enzanensis]|uniref:nuclear transport factor 2 family protein n=1 Tax=Actinokineospora enzanensis TaxID=155975 RepID=UPI0003734D9F|nr:nuclear transport factor 2 family protein [Actinokineospora enzanensis]
MGWSAADAVAYVAHHIETWNDHDLDHILDLYAEDAVLTSPLAEAVTGSEVVSGRAALREYFAAALRRYPDLRFEVLDVLRGTDGVTILMVGAGGNTVAEVLTVGPDRRVTRVAAHYSCSGLGPGAHA